MLGGHRRLTSAADGSPFVRVVSVIAATQIVDARGMWNVVVTETTADRRTAVSTDVLSYNHET